ncbi:hypothetical protein CH368_06180 [Leptospira levettii]|nr:hypothetical protein CH368_06180 [Leptospira levettii]
MDEIVNVLNNLYSALQTSTTTPADGGASYKSQIVLALQSVPVPVVPEKLESTNLKYSEKN